MIVSNLDIAMFGHKRIPSREGGIEIVVEELCTRMVNKGNRVEACPHAFASGIIMASATGTVHALNNAISVDSFTI